MMIEKRINSLSILLFENLLRYEAIDHFVSTRTGGHSHSPYDSLNLSFNVGDNSEKVLKNRNLFAGALSIPLTSLTTAKQIHDGHVKVVSGGMRGKGCVDYQGAINGTDAMVTNVLKESDRGGPCRLEGHASIGRRKNSESLTGALWLLATRYSCRHWTIHRALLL
jgi:hypothetical protein